MLLHSAHTEHLFLASWLFLALQKHPHGEKPCGEVREEASCHHRVQASPLNSSAFMAGFISSGFQVAILSDPLSWSDPRKIRSKASGSCFLCTHYLVSDKQTSLHAHSKCGFCVETITQEHMWTVPAVDQQGFRQAAKSKVLSACGWVFLHRQFALPLIAFIWALLQF